MPATARQPREFMMANELPVNVAIFVDYENVPFLDGRVLPDDAVLYLFRGAKQKAVDDATLTVISRCGPGRFRPVTIVGGRKNALDFHIAFYLGEHLLRKPPPRCFVVSADQGFDPLIRHLDQRGFAVSRHETLAKALAAASRGATAVPPPTKLKPAPSITDVVAFVASRPAKNRPRQTAGLVRILETHYKSSGLSSAAAESLVRELQAKGTVSEMDGKLKFNC